MVITFSTEVPVEETMVFEEVYEEELREDLETKIEMRKDGFMVYMLVDGELAGEIYGLLPKDIDPEEDAAVLSDVKEFNFLGEDAETPFATMYCSSNTILPKFQGKGLAKLFKSYFLGYAKGMGFSKMIGHNTHDTVEGINETFGAVNLKETANWYGTGKTAKFYRIDL